MGYDYCKEWKTWGQCALAVLSEYNAVTFGVGGAHTFYDALRHESYVLHSELWFTDCCGILAVANIEWGRELECFGFKVMGAEEGPYYYDCPRDVYESSAWRPVSASGSRWLEQYIPSDGRRGSP